MEILGRMEDERSENLKRLKIMEQVLKEELDEIRKDIRSKQEPESSQKEKGFKQLPPKSKDKERVPPRERSKTLPKKKVLKKGKTAVVVKPRIGKRAASDSVKKTLKRSFLRGPREKIENIEPVYLPFYRFLVGYKGMFFGGRKEGDLYIDGILGEVICGDRGDLDRSRGLKKLLKMTDLETKVYKGIGSGKKEDLQISRKASIRLRETRRALTSLEKKGIVESTTIEGDVKIFTVSNDLDIPRRSWSKDPDLQPQEMEGIEDAFAIPLINQKESMRMIGMLSDEIKVIQSDMVMYPFYIAKVVGEGRERFVAVDAISGKVDDPLAPVLSEVMTSLKKD
jgi:hypothetical protein